MKDKFFIQFSTWGMLNLHTEEKQKIYTDAYIGT